MNKGVYLGEVAIIYKVMPDSPEINLETIKENITKAIPKHAKLNSITEKPVAFGLKALEVQIILDDRKGGAEEIEQALNELENSKESYKIISNIMVSAKKEDLKKDLESKKETLQIRVKTLEKQEQTIKEKAEKLQSAVMEKIKK